MKYPATFTEDKEAGGFVVTFRDIPEAFTQGESMQEAEAMAKDVLLFVLEDYFDDRKTVPMPSLPQAGDILIELPVSVSAKVMLLNEMIAQKVRPVDLSRMMGIRSQDVTRILDLRHNTKIDTVCAAFKALGKSVELRIQ